MAELERICRPIAPELSRTAEMVSAALAAAGRLVGCPNVAPEADAGKMLRPALLLFAARLAKADSRLAVRLAAAVELVHAASLIHDDVIDGSDTRRGLPTTLARLGAADAVLFGDVIFTGAFNDAVSIGDNSMSKVLARAAGEVCAGEVRQNRAKGSFHVTRAEYFKIIDLKTASLFRACAVLAMLAGDGRRAAAAAERFGRSFGLGFQITDDLLDVIGDSRKTGKPNGCDLAQGKVTLPLVVYLAGLTARQRRAARERLSGGDAVFREDVLVELRRSRVVRAVRAAARRHFVSAVAALEGLPPGPQRKNLAALCRFAARRSY